MEDATAEDLDWYWRGWFYGTEPCDIALDTVKWAILDSVKLEPKNTEEKIVTQPVAKPILNSFDDISKSETGR